jgi:hypothetical protein
VLIGLQRAPSVELESVPSTVENLNAETDGEAGRLNPVTPVRVPLPKIFVVFGTTNFA